MRQLAGAETEGDRARAVQPRGLSRPRTRTSPRARRTP